MKKQFTTTLEGVTSNKTKTTIKLSMSNKDAMIFSQRYLQSLDKELIVAFDAPQAEMDFDDEDERPERRKITTDQYGVVESVGRQLDFSDAKPEERQASMTADQAEQSANEPETADHADEYAGKEIVITVRTNPDEGQLGDGEEDENLIEYVFPIVNGTGRTPKKFVNGEDTGIILGAEIKAELGLETSHGCYSIEELLGAGGELREVRGCDSRDEDFSWDKESDQSRENNNSELSDWEREVMGETGGSASQPEAGSKGETEEAGEQPAPTVDVEAYILEHKPQFDGLDHDYAALFERKKSGETWKEIALSIGMTPKDLSAAWNKYKSLVQKIIENQSH